MVCLIRARAYWVVSTISATINLFADMGKNRGGSEATISDK